MSHWIVKRAGVLGGRPYIRGTRLTVDYVRRELASGRTREDLIRAYPQLTPEALTAARDYVHQVLNKGVLRHRFDEGRSTPRYPGPALGRDDFSGES